MHDLAARLLNASIWTLRPCALDHVAGGRPVFTKCRVCPHGTGATKPVCADHAGDCLPAKQNTKGRLASLVLIIMSCIASLRYINWRLTETLGFERLLDAVLGYGPADGGILRSDHATAGATSNRHGLCDAARSLCLKTSMTGLRWIFSYPHITNR